MDEFTHSSGDNEHFGFAFGFEALGELFDDGIVLDGGDGRPVEDTPHGSLADFGEPRFAADSIPRLVLSRGEASISGGGMRIVIVGEVIHFGEQFGRGDGADALN